MLQLLLAIALALSVQPVRAAGDDHDDELLSAGNQEHLWFAFPQVKPAATNPRDTSAKLEANPGMDLYHHAADLGGPYYKAQSWLAVRPVALASWGPRVWVVFPAKGQGPNASMEVDTIEVIKNPALGIYLSEPSGRMEMVASLPAHGRLASFVGASTGPVALILPEGTGAISAPPENATDNAASKPHLAALQNGRWVDIPLPEDFKWDRATRLAAAGDDGGNLILLTPEEPASKRAVRYDRNSAGQWDRSTIELDLHLVRSVISIDGRVAIISTGPGAQSDIEISYLRLQGAVPLTRIGRPSERWDIAGMAGGLHLLERDPQGVITIRSIEPLSGEMLSTRRMEVQPLTAGKLWQVSMLIALSISGLLLVFLIKPVSKAPVALPTTMEPLPVMLRVASLLIDLLPAGVLVGFILRKPLVELLTLPVLSIDIEKSIPYLLMAGLTVLHSTVSELSRGTTLGKALVGARVVTAEGQRPRVGQTLLRNGLKCLILVVPPLAIFALINPHLQGLPDMAAGTVVVHTPEESTERNSDD